MRSPSTRGLVLLCVVLAFCAAPLAFAALLTVDGPRPGPAIDPSLGLAKAPDRHPLADRSRVVSPAGTAPELLQGFVAEVEPNDTAATATPLVGTNVVVFGNIAPVGDIDYYSFSGNAGDRVYAAVMTSFSGSVWFDSLLYLVSPDGATVIEFDDNDGVLGGQSSSIAGASLPATGRYYLAVRGGGVYGLSPYHLHLRVQRSGLGAEVEPNNTPATATPLPASGWVAGVHSSAADKDYFSVQLNAGDSVFLSLDADPERNNITWNPRLGFGLFGDVSDQLLLVDDTNTVSPNSEALFATVKNTGTYYAYVDSASSPGGSTETYRLSVSVHPAAAPTPFCTTYSSGDGPQDIPDGGLANSSITVPGHPRIAYLTVAIQLNETVMADIDAYLRSPAGNNNGLFTDVGSTGAGGQAMMDLVLDDGAAVPISSTSLAPFTAMKGLVYQPDLLYRLWWFNGEDGGGRWTLDLRDDTINGSSGQLLNWSLTICEPPPAPACAGTLVTAYSNNFEQNDGGFTYAGVNDDWGLGLPSAASTPIASCASGVNCWKTNLAGYLNLSTDEELVSPSISLKGLTAPIRAAWAQKYAMDNIDYNFFTASVRESNGANPQTLFSFLDPQMIDAVGLSDSEEILESAGWGLVTADLASYAGKDIQLAFHVVSDPYFTLSGLAVDDFLVTACCTAASCDDGDSCTIDICDAARGCVHQPNTPAVNDSLALTNSGMTTTVAWTDAPGPFYVYRGLRSPLAGWSYNHTCLGGPVPGPSVSDMDMPGNGGAFYYLVTRKGPCGESIPGRDSEGRSIPNSAPCP